MFSWLRRCYRYFLSAVLLLLLLLLQQQHVLTRLRRPYCLRYDDTCSQYHIIDTYQALSACLPAALGLERTAGRRTNILV